MYLCLNKIYLIGRDLILLNQKSREKLKDNDSAEGERSMTSFVDSSCLSWSSTQSVCLSVFLALFFFRICPQGLVQYQTLNVFSKTGLGKWMNDWTESSQLFKRADGIISILTIENLQIRKRCQFSEGTEDSRLKFRSMYSHCRLQYFFEGASPSPLEVPLSVWKVPSFQISFFYIESPLSWSERCS